MKIIFILLICGFSLKPLIGMAVTPEENAHNIRNLQRELSIANESIKDLNAQLNNKIKISGYADVEYETSSLPGGNEGFRLHHLSLLFDKSLSDKWQFFSEIKYEDAPKINSSTTTGEILVDGVYFSYLWQPFANFRVGRFFTPAGIWSVNHYPPFVLTQMAPQHIGIIFPQTVEGAMVYGDTSIGNSFLNYNFYVGNGEGNTGRGDENSEKAVGLNISMLFPFFNRCEVGATVYTDRLYDGSDKSVQGIHSKIDIDRFVLQMEYAEANFEFPNGYLASRNGYYAQLVYVSNKWSLGLRNDKYDEIFGDSVDPITINSLFVNYFLDENFVMKLEHHLTDEAGEDDNLTIMSLGAYFNQ